MWPQKRNTISSEGHGGDNSSSSAMRDLSLLMTLCVGSAASAAPWGQVGALDHHCGGDCSHIN